MEFLQLVSEEILKTELWALVLVLIGTLIGSFAPILLKKGMLGKKLSIISIIFNYKVLCGYIIYFISSLFFMIALKGGELSTLYPFVSLGYIWVIIYSKIFLKEKITTFKIIGIVLVVLGVAIIGGA